MRSPFSLRRFVGIAAFALPLVLMGCSESNHQAGGIDARVAALGSVDIDDCVEGPMVIPDDYVSRLVFQPPLAGLGRVVRSESGIVYFEHGGFGEGRRVTRLDVDGNSSSTVLEVPPWDAPITLVGGPADSFFAVIGRQIQQVQPDGSHSAWGQHLGLMPWIYTPDGRMLAIGPGGTSVVELAPDGSFTTLLSGLTMVYDIAAAADGDIYVVDFPAEQLIELAPDGSSRVLTSIAPDNTDITLDDDDNLYLNNAKAGLARVDRITGALTPMHVSGAPCHVVQSPADYVFDSNDRAVFASWVESRLTWADFNADTGGELLHTSWANNTAARLGPDDALYVGVPGCGTAVPSEIARFTADGANEVYLDGITSTINSLDFDDAGDLYYVVSSETGVGIYHHDRISGSLSLVPNSTIYDVDAIAFDTMRDRLLASSVSPVASEGTVRAYDPTGLQSAEVVGLPKALMALLLDVAPDGTIYGFGMERDRFFSGPVDHFLLDLDLDLDSGSSQEVFQHTRQGCCPASNFSIDEQGHAWIVLNPDFLLFHVDPDHGATLFACSLPIDSLGAFRTTDGDILLNSPEGLYRIWQPSLVERVQQVQEELDVLAYYDALEPWQQLSLEQPLTAAIEPIERGQTRAARNKLRKFLWRLQAFVNLGFLTESQADVLFLGVGEILDRL
jgi:sugar lactone lactonase YvrE